MLLDQTLQTTIINLKGPDNLIKVLSPLVLELPLESVMIVQRMKVVKHLAAMLSLPLKSVYKHLLKVMLMSFSKPKLVKKNSNHTLNVQKISSAVYKILTRHSWS